jgi:hypothetical protein
MEGDMYLRTLLFDQMLLGRRRELGEDPFV